MQQIHKYPRTRHIEGSRLQLGDEDLDAVPFATLRSADLVVEEKVDGANCAISFTPDGDLRLQSRGHYLTGGHRERHFALLKSWAQAHSGSLLASLGARYVMYGEWVFAKHTIFYDALPHYFLEFDLLDLDTRTFLSTARRREILNGTPVVSVPVLSEGPLDSLQELRSLVRPSLYKSREWRAALRIAAAESGSDLERVVTETDASDASEGLYVKVERDGVVTDRLKFVRSTFLSAVLESGGHWLDRPLVPNRLAPGIDLFGVVT